MKGAKDDGCRRATEGGAIRIAIPRDFLPYVLSNVLGEIASNEGNVAFSSPLMAAGSTDSAPGRMGRPPEVPHHVIALNESPLEPVHGEDFVDGNV